MPLRALLTLLALAVFACPATAAAAERWFKTDTHVHSVVSGDGLPDLGVISAAGKARGYNAMFITDHQAGSNLATSTVIANHIAFEDDLGEKWDPDFFGAPSARLAELATTPVRSGAQSLHVKATAPASGESYVMLKRGPSLRSGDLILKFSAHPTRIDPGSGMYVSVALGGDPSDDVPDGYTTRDGVTHPGKSTILVWQLGAARSASSDPNARVVTKDLPYTLGAWNDYEINVTTGAVKHNGSTVAPGGSGGVNAIPAADLPLAYNALSKLKMSASASGGGTAEGYFDRYNLDASVPVPNGEEFAYRNTVLNPYDTPDFRLFPSVEMGTSRHVQRFNFGIQSGAEYNAFFRCDAFGNNCQLRRGIDGILPAQETGYPTQLNHPNMPGGVKADEYSADGYNAFGADIMETREDIEAVPRDTMIELWDETLKRGRVLIGTWSSDMHKTESLDVPDRGLTTSIRSPALEFDELMRALYEGRAFMARHGFTGEIAFNLDPASSEPYPSRYPVQVSDARSTADVHLRISDGIPAGARVVWVVDDAEVASDATSGASYEATRAVSLGGAWTYVRAELRNSAGTRIAMTEPIFFSDVAGLPPDASFGISGVATANGRGYTRIATRGVTGSSWNGASKALTMTLNNTPAALTRMGMDTGSLVPTSVRVDGAMVPQVDSAAALNAAAGSAWRYEDATHRLELKTLQPAAASDVVVQFTGGAADAEAPDAPPTLTATAAGPTRVDLAWGAATDNRGVTGYRVRRGPCGSGSVIATLGGGARSYADEPVAPGTTTSYQVQALDAAGNVSPLSPCASATTPTLTTTTFTPVADAHVGADAPTARNGSATKLRADASPDTRSYLRFDLSGLQGTVTKARLVMSATSASSAGFDARRVADTTWSESLISYSNAPPLATGAPLGSSGAIATGATPAADVTSAVTGNGAVGFALTTTSSTALSLASREGGAATAPKLVVETASGTPPPPPPPPAGGTATFTPVADAFVAADLPTARNGANVKLRADASPDTRSYLRFDVSGLSGTVKKATLVTTATSAHSAGFDVRRVADTTWSESLLSYANAPPIAAGLPLGSSLGFALGGAPSVDVTAAVAGNGPVGFALTTTSSTALSLASREAGATAPKLVVETG
jgi:hypothetical protein